jgi:hypothetical protein
MMNMIFHKTDSDMDGVVLVFAGMYFDMWRTNR